MWRGPARIAPFAALRYFHSETYTVSRCRLDAGPIYQVAVWINRYSKYWQSQFDTLAAWLDQIERAKQGKTRRAAPRSRSRRRPISSTE